MKNKRKRTNIPNRRCGFTLVEVMFSLAILSILMLSLYSLLAMANVIFRTNAAYFSLNDDLMQSLRYVARELGQTSGAGRFVATADANGNSVIRFQIPVDVSGDGTGGVMDAQQKVQWGAYDSEWDDRNGRLGAWIEYAVNGTQLVRRVLDPNLNAIAGTDRVVLKRIDRDPAHAGPSFSVTTPMGEPDIRDIAVRLQSSDQIGQDGQLRNFPMTYTIRAFLRNRAA